MIAQSQAMAWAASAAQWQPARPASSRAGRTSRNRSGRHVARMAVQAPAPAARAQAAGSDLDEAWFYSEVGQKTW